VKYLPLFHHFKAIYQFPKHIMSMVKFVPNAALNKQNYSDIIRHVYSISCFNCTISFFVQQLTGP